MIKYLYLRSCWNQIISLYDHFTFCSSFSCFFLLNASKKVYVATSKAAELLRPAPAGTVDTITALNAGTSPKMCALITLYRISQNYLSRVIESMPLSLII